MLRSILVNSITLGLVIFSFAQPLFAAEVIYRSVGPANTAALATGSGSNTLIISGTTASFSSSLPDRIGIGDTLQYDTDNNGIVDAIAFITSRINAQQYNVSDNNGAGPTAVTNDEDWQCYRAYTSLYDAERGNESLGILSSVRNFDAWTNGYDLVTNDKIWTLVCYADAVDTTPVMFDDWTTDNDHYIKIIVPYLSSQVGQSQRHNGVWGSSGYQIIATPATDRGVITIRDNYIQIQGLQIEVQGTNTNANGILVDTTNVVTDSAYYISQNIIRKDGQNAQYGSGIGVWPTNLSSGNNPTVRIWNNIINGFNGTDNFGIFIGYRCSPQAYVYNNTVINCYSGYIIDADGSGNPSVVVKNNITQNCNDGFFERNGGNFHATSDYNISDVTGDTTGISTSYREGLVSIVTFNGSDDYHLNSSDTIARNQGTNLSADSNLSFSNDNEGEARTGVWDIGADEYSLAVGSTATPTPSLTITPIAVITLIYTVTPTFIVRGDTWTVMPNPFLQGRGIESTFILPEGIEHDYVIQVFDSRGRKIRKLVNSNKWDGRNEQGNVCESGVYIMQFKQSNLVKTGTIVLLKD